MKSFFVLLKKELLQLFRMPSVLFFLVLSGVVYGNGFAVAINLYSTASRSALNDRLYAKGFEPVFGVFVPSFGGFFLIFSLLLPFLVIPLLALEKKSNTLVLLYQAGFGKFKILAAKFVSAVIPVMLSLLVALISVFFWKVFGGHIAVKEFALLFFGYFLYAVFVISVSFFSGAISETISSGAVIALGIVLYSWIVDFLKTVSSSAFVGFLSSFTFTSLLKEFEQGIFSLKAVLLFVSFSYLFLFLAFVFVKPGPSLNLKKVFSGLLPLFILFFLSANFDYKKDITESYRNSFPPSVSSVLKKIDRLKIKVYLRKSDSRFYDYNNEFLSRLLLVKPNTEVEFAKGKQLEKNYGIFVYCLNGKGKSKCMKTYSNSPEEAFMILSKLSGLKIPYNYENPYPGFPIVVGNVSVFYIRFFYFVILSVLFVALFLFANRRKTFK